LSSSRLLEGAILIKVKRNAPLVLSPFFYIEKDLPIKYPGEGDKGISGLGSRRYGLINKRSSGKGLQSVYLLGPGRSIVVQLPEAQLF
jgi:hypothetical protein